MSDLFIGVYPGGLVYADRGREEHGDYARVAFLDYGTLTLRTEPGACPVLTAEARNHADRIRAQCGQLFALSATADRDASGRLTGSQAVRLGWALA